MHIKKIVHVGFALLIVATSSMSFASVRESPSKASLGREAGSGMATGKRQHKPVVMLRESPSKASLRESPSKASVGREAGSGQATGKRQHQPIK